MCQYETLDVWRLKWRSDHSGTRRTILRNPMSNGSQQSKLKDISPNEITRNEDNPRLFFRSDEMATLMASIKQYGIQVPITVFEEGGRYHLIDGERRWRCADKLNLKRIPAIVQPKPTPLNNLLLMFNIHALREQWDYLTIAN